MSNKKAEYQVIPFPKMRRFAIDAGHRGHRKHIIHGLIEVDVTEVRQHLREYKERTGESLSFTAFVITCIGKAVDENKMVHAWLNWRNQLVVFEDVNVNTMVEVDMGGKKIAMPLILRAVNRRTLRDIHEEIRAAQRKPAQTKESKFMHIFLLLPGFIRHPFYWIVTRFPQRFREMTSPIIVTAVGMFGKGGGWGIPKASFPLTITLGGIAEKPGVVEGRIEIREYLDLTLSFDHDIIDGAPAARFTQRLRELIESGYGLLSPQ